MCKESVDGLGAGRDGARTRPWWVSLVAMGVGGGVVGVLAKLADASTLPGAGDLFSYMGLWIVLATVIAVWSPSRVMAALRVGVFMLAMVTTYYVTTYRLFGIFPMMIFAAWAGVAVGLAPLFALLVWPARQGGWAPAVAAAAPIGLLLAEAFSFRWRLPRYLPQVLFDVAAAAALLVVLPRDGVQRRRVGLVAPFLFLAALLVQRAVPWVLGILRGFGLRR